MSKKVQKLSDELIRVQDDHIANLKALIESQDKIIAVQDDLIEILKATSKLEEL
jgi:hypothetical protein